MTVTQMAVIAVAFIIAGIAKGAIGMGTVSYTHLTLPTIYSV